MRSAMDIPRQPRRGRKVLRWLVAVAVTAGVALSTLALAEAEPAAPEVSRAGLWVATVERGEFVREIRAPGTLVPNRVRWVTATTAGRVETIAVQPGDAVEASSIVVELTNSDLELAALEAEADRAAARASLVNLRATLKTGEIDQRSSLATTSAELADAQREKAVTAELSIGAIVGRNEVERAAERHSELASKHDLAEKRLGVLANSRKAQIAAERTRVDRLATVAAFRREQVAGQRVTAGLAGIVQDVAVEPGQWVNPGDVLAKVADPTQLDAELQVAQVQAKDLVRGQPVAIDTRAGIVGGRVRRIEPSVREGTVTVDVELLGELPSAARPDLSVDGAVELSREPDALFIKRPVHSQPGRPMPLFKVERDTATRTRVELGLGSAATIEIVAGAKPGDTFIVSDMTDWAEHERIELK